ncbi:MAG: peptidoglycan DD-metalloendopeptidase family protein [Marinagarivorans sp.]|nr:peptidoglycan DD-metalloendopeptidase family protein [Marinagarivorans sp.]
MKIIFIDSRHGGTKTITLGLWSKALCVVCMLLLPIAAATLMALQWSVKGGHSILTMDVSKSWQKTLSSQQDEIETTRKEAQSKLEALTIRVAELQARLVRLDALGERLTVASNLDAGEFDFSQPPAVGGPSHDLENRDFEVTTFMDMIDDLAFKIDDRQHQLQTLEALMANEKIQESVFVAGRPVEKGYLSSRFGRRADPITGRVSLHSGIDFAGKEGADIVAVAAGVVTWAAERYGYGNLVEINHGNGFKTRYAHCKETLIKPGDVVKKGQVIALLGSTGRSTGPHVHFEVYKHGRAVDPASYIHRVSR